MLHQASFSHESKQNLYFVNSSLNRIEHAENTAVTVNPIKSFQTELDMSSNSIYVADDNAPAHMNMSNVGTTELPTSFRKSDCVDKLNVDCEYNITSQFPNVAFDERQPSLQLINVSDHETCRTSDCQPTRDDANILPLSTGQKSDLPMYEAAIGDSMTETGTTLSLCSPEKARHVMRDIAVDEGTSSKDNLPIVPDSSVVIEELVKFKTSLENEMKFHKHALETIADQLKMIAVKDIQDIPEGQGLSFDMKGLTKEMLSYQDDKGILEESFILHFSSLEEKHVCNPLHEEQNAEKQEISIKSDCITEPSCFVLDKTGDMENPAEDGEKDKEPAIVSLDKLEGFKTLAEDAEKDRKTGIVSMDCMEDLKCSMEDGEKDREYASVCEYHQKPILTVPFNNKERHSGHDSDAFHVAYCMDVRVESSSSSTHFSHYNPVETAIRVPISVNKDNRAEFLGCGADSEDCFASHDIHAGERSGVASDESHSIETLVLKVKNSNNNSEYPNFGTIKRDGSDKTLCTVDDNFQMQENLSLASEKVHPPAVAGSSIAAVINPSSNMDLTADDCVSEGCSNAGTDSFEIQKLEKLQDSFTRNPDIDQKESTVHAVEDKSTLDSEGSPVLSHTLQESNKMCYLTENNSIDPEMKIYDTSKESAKDNIPVCPLVNINDTKPGCSTHQMFQEKTEESIVASQQKLTVGQNVSSVTCLTKEGNGTWEMSEKLVIDSTEIDSATSQKSVGNNVSAPAFVEIDTKRNVRQRSDLSSGFTGHPVSSVHSGQELLESFPDASDEINGYSDMAESGHYTYSGPISLSGPISYSGPIPFSGSISIRSDSSTTSTRSFAFPILASEWNSSPVKMAQADPRYHRKKRGWHFLCFCGGASASS